MEETGTLNYDFLKRFSDVAEKHIRDTGELPLCEITVFTPVKVKKGTKNNPSPFYDREMDTEDDSLRYTLYQSKSYRFKFGDTYEKPESVNVSDSVMEDENHTKEISRVRPDEACRMLYKNLKTGKYTIDVINPVKEGDTIYYVRTYNPIDGFRYSVVDSGNVALMESIKEWKPAHKGEYKPVLYQQFYVDNVTSLAYLPGTKDEWAFYREENIGCC